VGPRANGAIQASTSEADAVPCQGEHRRINLDPPLPIIADGDPAFARQSRTAMLNFVNDI
jgi:hypothetical protein